MWPFKKPQIKPEDVSCEGMTAKYHNDWEYWSFHYDGFDFNIQGLPFNKEAFNWAREVVPIIRKIEPEIKIRVIEALDGWPCDKTKGEILQVCLNNYGRSKRFEISIAGDDSWGDFGVDVVITDGKIEEVFGGD